MPESDYALLKNAHCDFLYCPEVADIYPQGEETEDFDLGTIADAMEGKFRPGHFLGVATVVKRLFEAVLPHKAFFGEKDYQQLLVVQKMVQTSRLDVEVIGCPVMREIDGLAMSSRNFRLNAHQRAAAPAIYEALQYLKLMAGTEKSPQKAISKAIEIINNHPDLAVEYLEIVDQQTLEPVNHWSDSIQNRAFVAVFAGDVRLIDNLLL
jgi:pantoate--beta-alanine ligase